MVVEPLGRVDVKVCAGALVPGETMTRVLVEPSESVEVKVCVLGGEPGTSGAVVGVGGLPEGRIVMNTVEAGGQVSVLGVAGVGEAGD